ncbi:hypothetical protein GCM10023169_27660 [Georgenia halophila]|uniref:Multisubunit sodium/proton antiporter MrpF subunit n=1 Tax=Georgenia halophila TaxID=620889 RepID=A0ABP8LES5_9MICO
MILSTFVDVVLVVSFSLLGVAVLVALVRMEKGPTMFDRVASLDVVTVTVLGGCALMTARTGRTDLVPVLAVLAVVGFVGSVALARFAAVEAPEEARILSKEEVARALAAQQALADADAPVHDPDAPSDDADAAGGGR